MNDLLVAPPLASLRDPSGTDGDRQQRRRAGQVWDAPAEIGHDLEAGRKRVGITTSQRAGVQDRDVIIATASLEVGYNDEHVGVVLQHKAPRDPAAFIQRRGRGGRLPEQRPWTIVVLSDFGRDRIAYQSYERLFDPALPARSLPIANQAVRRMQAAFASLDWLAKQRTRGYSVWDDLTKPRNTAGQRALAEAIERTLRDPVLRHDLETHLSRALGIERDEARALLWSPPRSIVLEMLPTALRRLTSGWFHGVKGLARIFRRLTVRCLTSCLRTSSPISSCRRSRSRCRRSKDVMRLPITNCQSSLLSRSSLRET